MKKQLLLIVLICLAGMALAQVPSDQSKQRITEVKQAEGQYIYADKTSGTVEKALELAQETLLREVKDYLRQNGENVENAETILKEQMVTITVQRGDKFRAFVYIEKQFDQDVVKAEPTEQNAKEELQKVEENQKIEPQIMAEEPQKREEFQTEAKLQQIAAMATRLQVYDYITQLQKDGENVSFSAHPSPNEMESMYLVLYKRGGAVEAILTPTDTHGQRRNLATGMDDDITNHPGTSVNGIKFNE